MLRCVFLLTCAVMQARGIPVTTDASSSSSEGECNNPSVSEFQTLYDITVVERGSLHTPDYALYYKDAGGNFISTWHDLPLKADDNTYNMVVEIPRWNNAKYEQFTKEPLTPIKHDTRNGEVRFVDNLFPFVGYPQNYGALPQTWENSNKADPDTGFEGDNDPIDVYEIGNRIRRTGEIVQVKILGALPFIDEDETDWKLLALAVDDPLAAVVHDVTDVEQHFPGLIAGLEAWLTTPRGDDPPEERVLQEPSPRDAASARQVVEKRHQDWRDLMAGVELKPKLSLVNVQAEGGERIDQEAAHDIVEATPQRNPEGDQPVPVAGQGQVFSSPTIFVRRPSAGA